MADLQVTPAIKKVLEEALSSNSLNQELQKAATSASSADAVSWKLLKEIVSGLNAISSQSTKLLLHEICSGSTLKLTSPKPRERSPELIARLAKLQDDLDKKAYDAMVSDITKAERDADQLRDPGPLPTARLQNAFGVHVVVTMGTFFAFAYYGSKEYLGFDDLHAGLLGVLGLAFGMFLETMLLIIRSNRPQPLEERYPQLFDEKLWAAGGPAKVAESSSKAAPSRSKKTN